jgi:hypothetical protein
LIAAIKVSGRVSGRLSLTDATCVSAYFSVEAGSKIIAAVINSMAEAYVSRWTSATGRKQTLAGCRVLVESGRPVATVV